MASDDNESTSARRLRMRRRTGRGAGGFASGGVSTSTRSESMRSREDDYEEDDVDHVIDPEAVHRSIVQQAGQPSPQASNILDGQDSPQDRMNQVNRAGNAAFAKEYRLNLLHRMLLRNVPLDQIARQLGVSVSTVQKDRAELKKQLRAHARTLDVEEMIGNQSGYYDEVSGMALRIASLENTPVPMKLAGLRTSLAANADRNRFYHSSGVYDVLRFRKAEDGSAISDIQLLMQNTQRMLQSLASGGFDEFSAADPDDLEVLPL